MGERRVRCHNCNRMFDRDHAKNYIRLKVSDGPAINRHIFCGVDCMEKYMKDRYTTDEEE